MKLKKGIKLKGITNEMLLGLNVAETILKSLDSSKELIITSLLDGNHMRNSLHYKGDAADIRTRNWSNEFIEKFVLILKVEMGEWFDIVKENTHIHIEYDYKK